MGFSTTLRSSLPHSSSHSFRLYYLGQNWKQQSLVHLSFLNRRNQSLQCINSVTNNKQHINGNGAAEPTRLLLERLFGQTQKLEEQRNKDSSHLPQDVQLDLNLETLESDLKAALAVLKKKEEDLEEAERKVMLERNELSRAREELVQREEVIASAFSTQEKLEEELKKANLILTSQAREIEELKLQVQDREQEILAARTALSLKEDELEKLKYELVKKTEEASRFEFELNSKAQLLNEANEVIRKQELEIQSLQKAIFEKERELEISLTSRKANEEKLKVAETKLEKQTAGWLLAQEDLRKLEVEASKHRKETGETLEEFRHVKKLLVDVRSELMSSQASLVSSRKKMEEQDKILEKQLAELEELKEGIASYMKSLKDAWVEVESEKVRLRVAEARNRELERELSIERQLMESLQEELKKGEALLQQALQEMSFMQAELDRRNSEFEETRKLLEVKEAELVEATLEIQQLKSEQAALRLVLEERDLELSNARKALEEVNQEVEELKILMDNKENELIQATNMLKEKDGHVRSMQHELTDAKLRFAEAESVVEHIAELTSKLVVSIKDEDHSLLSPSSTEVGEEQLNRLVLEPTDNSRWRLRQLETEIGLTREILRDKEMKLLATQRALAVKDEELKTVLAKLEERGEELKRLKNEMTDDASELRKLYELAQERIGDKTVGDLAIEKLQLEAVQLEVEAATGALQKLADLSRDLLSKTSSIIEVESDSNALEVGESHRDTFLDGKNDDFGEVKARMVRLSALSEQLVREAGITVGSD